MTAEWAGFDRQRFSAVMTSEVAGVLQAHLSRGDGDEDLCFVLWRPSLGRHRATAVICDVVLPEPGERFVHGNVSFDDAYFFRAAHLAAEADAGIGLIHSHPQATTWQGLSEDDHAAESGHAGQSAVLTDLPILGLTLATGTDTYSARLWTRTAPRTYEPRWCHEVRVVGGQYKPSYNPQLHPAPSTGERLVRTVSAWGDAAQADLSRIRIGVIGLGSVGDHVGEALARTGIEEVMGMDFDGVEYRNLDRIIHAHARDARVRRAKIATFVRGLRRSTVASYPKIRGVEYSIVEPDGWAEALDCDVLFSCVDRPWPRAALNLLAYAHLIPVVDGGVLVDAGHGRMRDATWRAHVAAPGRRCLECLGQYDPAMVSVEREGLLDDEDYINNLPAGHAHLAGGENVFAFTAATAAAEVNQLLTMVLAPGGISDFGAQQFHLKAGDVDVNTADCEPGCLYSGPLLALGDTAPITVTGTHHAAQKARTDRHRHQRRVTVRLRLWLDDMLERAIR